MTEARGTRIVRCPSCRCYYRIAASGARKTGTRLCCAKCGEVFPLPAAAAREPAPRASHSRGRILVATDGEETGALVGEVLRAEGYEVRGARSGEEAWKLVEAWQPQVALIDVALPGTPSFELCDRVRAGARRRLGIILIASVFQHTRYKRAPTSLYGADDYIEKHHVRDWLPGKVARLLSATPAAAAASPAHREARLAERERQSLVREECPAPGGGARRGLERLRESLRRYARIIVADIALYNEELVEQGIREGSFHRLLQKELEEGRRLYLSRVPPSAGEEDHFAEAVREFVEKRSGARGGTPPGREGGHGRS